jgi:hypothetical protein
LPVAGISMVNPANDTSELHESCTKKRTKPLQPMIYEISIKSAWFGGLSCRTGIDRKIVR